MLSQRFAVRMMLILLCWIGAGNVAPFAQQLRAQQIGGDQGEIRPATAAPRVGRPPTPREEGSRAHAETLSLAFRRATDAILPSVVKVKTHAKGEREMLLALGGLRIPVEAPDQESLGSGVIIDPSGIVLTNNHVVKEADAVILELQDGTEYHASEIMTDPLTDIAIVRFHPTRPLPSASFGDSDQLEIGDWVLAVGYPLDLETSVSAGIISAKGRSLSKVPRAHFLQTDAAINPGNSGGPLVDLRGQIVGINTAIASQTGGYQGIGFAVPGNLARFVANQLHENGRVRRGALGVSIQELTKDLAAEFLGDRDARGVLVTDVRENTPAQQAGVRPGDVITHFGNRLVDSTASLQRAVEQVPVGSSHELGLVRFGQPLAVQVQTLEYRQDGLRSDLRGEYRKLAPPPRRAGSNLGLQVEDLADIARARGLQTDAQAVVITQVDEQGIAAEKGLHRGWLILQVRDKPVATVAEFTTALRGESLQRGILLLVRDPSPEGGDNFVLLKGE